MINFADVIQAPMRELQAFIAQNQFEAPEEGFYAHVLLAFLKADEEALLELAESSQQTQVKMLATLRHQIITNQVDFDLLEKLERILPLPSDWQGEIAYTMGLAYLENDEHKHALRCFKLANKRLWDIGARKKAVKSLLNIVLTEARSAKTQRGVAGFEFVKEKAVEVGDDVLTGICFYHISKEYFKNQDFDLALNSCNQALDSLSADRGTPYFYEALVQRGQTFLKLGRLQDAQIDLQAAKATRHIHIQDALKVMEKLVMVINGEDNGQSKQA